MKSRVSQCGKDGADGNGLAFSFLSCAATSAAFPSTRSRSFRHFAQFLSDVASDFQLGKRDLSTAAAYKEPRIS